MPKRVFRDPNAPFVTCSNCGETKPKEAFYKRRLECRACAAKRALEWNRVNRERHRASAEKYTAGNRDRINASGRERYHRHIDRERKRSAVKNARYGRKQRTAWACAYMKRRKKNDSSFRALLTCKRRMWIALKSVGVKKKCRSLEMIGTTRAGLMAYLESLFKPGMTWENRGHGHDKWHIDHKRPCASFDLRDPVQQKECFHYTNLQPLWSHENLAKADHWDE